MQLHPLHACSLAYTLWLRNLYKQVSDYVRDPAGRRLVDSFLDLIICRSNLPCGDIEQHVNVGLGQCFVKSAY